MVEQAKYAQANAEKKLKNSNQTVKKKEKVNVFFYISFDYLGSCTYS
jgi:sulfur relay (sulfurtransferase) complex TusBCD TusD component (DsrE family)